MLRSFGQWGMGRALRCLQAEALEPCGSYGGFLQQWEDLIFGGLSIRDPIILGPYSVRSHLVEWRAGPPKARPVDYCKLDAFRTLPGPGPHKYVT